MGYKIKSISYKGKKLVVKGYTYNTYGMKMTANTATVKITSKMKNPYEIGIGGLVTNSTTMSKCKNSGKVTLSGKVGSEEIYVGGLSGEATPWSERVMCNYSKAKVKGSKGAVKGQVIGYYEGAETVNKRNIYNNYYTSAGKAYGETYISWKAWMAKATKVSSITESTCPKLGSKYWTYSKKYKRLILKNNKER